MSDKIKHVLYIEADTANQFKQAWLTHKVLFGHKKTYDDLIVSMLEAYKKGLKDYNKKKRRN